MPCINGSPSQVLIRDAQFVDARSLLMLIVTRHHAEHALNHEYLTPARIVHYRVGKSDEVIKYSVPIFSSFSQCFVEFMQ